MQVLNSHTTHLIFGIKPKIKRTGTSTRPADSFEKKTSVPPKTHWQVDSMAKHLKGHYSLHGVNSLERLKLYQKNKAYTVLDVDFWYDKKQEQLVVSHNRPIGKKPLLSEWLEAFAQMPKEKRVALQLDMKNNEAALPLIETLNQFKSRHPDVWQESMIILNGDIPIGKSHRFNLFDMKTWGVILRKRLTLKTMQTLSKAFPEAVISLGISNTLKSIDDVTLQAVDRTLSKLPTQGKIFSIPAHITINQSLVDLLTKHNTLVKFWSGQAHNFKTIADGTNLRRDIQIPANTPHWIEF